jgi:hypothetical protein
MISAAILLAAASVPPPVDGPLQPLSFLVGHCWRGEFKGSGAVDTHCFEPLHGGKHIRDRHEVKNKEGKTVYAGESIYGWNGKTKRVEFAYFSSDGGVSYGSMTAKDGSLDFGDEVYNGADGKEIRISTLWRRVGESAYDTETRSAFMPTGQRIVRYSKVD